MTVHLWHCVDSRSLRPLWALEELGFDYELTVLPFPPRVLQQDYLDTNVLGTVPYFTHGERSMTESCAICHYLCSLPGGERLGLPAEHPDYANWLNWLYQADATLTFPQTIYFRYSVLEPSAEKSAAGEDYAKWFIARLRRLDAHLEAHNYLAGDRFTVADIAVTFALHFGDLLKLSAHYRPQTLAYLERMRERDSFQRANAIGRPAAEG